MNRAFHFRSSSAELGPLEERLLQALWRRGNGTVRELLAESCPDLAYTTVMTTLDRLFKKNLLSRQAEGRAFRYTARFSREELQRQAAAHAVRELLSASNPSSLPLSYLVEIVTGRDVHLLDQLHDAVEAKRRELQAQSDKSANEDNG